MRAHRPGRFSATTPNHRHRVTAITESLSAPWCLLSIRPQEYGPGTECSVDGPQAIRIKRGKPQTDSHDCGEKSIFLFISKTSLLAYHQHDLRVIAPARCEVVFTF